MLRLLKDKRVLLVLAIVGVFVALTMTSTENFTSSRGSGFWHHAYLKQPYVMYTDSKKFVSDYYKSLRPVEDISGVEELQKPEKKGLSSSEHYVDFVPGKEVDEFAKPFNPNNYVISEYQDNTLMKDLVDYTDAKMFDAPDMTDIETVEYKKIADLEEPLGGSQLSGAFEQVDTDKFYKQLEMHKLRGGNMTGDYFKELN